MVEYRNALERPRLSDRDRFRIPRDEGQAAVLEAIGMLSAIAVLAVAIGLLVAVPLAMALNDICASLQVLASGPHRGPVADETALGWC